MSEVAAVLTVAVIAGSSAALIGAWLSRAAQPSGKAASAEERLLGQVEDCLPRTQCAQCGYPGCRPYAQAILADEIGIGHCPPGGDATVQALADLLGRDVVPLVAAPGTGDDALPGEPDTAAVRVANIVEADCIGCALCLPACPTDAIVGAPRFMHTVVAQDCTGCELCLAPCPVDCIVMQDATPLSDRWRWPTPASAAVPQR